MKFKGKIVTASLAIIINLALAITKLYIGLATNSLCIMTDSINNFGDTFIFLVAVIGFIFISSKPTQKFPYGKGRMEYVVSFIMALIITFVGLSFIYTSLERLFYARPIWFNWIYFYILLGSVAVKLLLGFYIKWVNKEHQSEMLKMMYADSFVDSIVTFVVALSFILINYVKITIDAILGLVISIFIIVNGIKFIIESGSKLIGENLDSDVLKKLKKTLLSNEAVKNVGKINYHDYGKAKKMVIIEIDFNNDLNLNEIYDNINKMRLNIKKEFNLDADFTLKGENYGES